LHHLFIIINKEFILQKKKKRKEKLKIGLKEIKQQELKFGINSVV
jgi:hypothetical protein